MHLGEPLKVGDYVRLKETPMRGISAVTVGTAWVFKGSGFVREFQVLDGKIGKVLAISEDDGNYAYILEIDGVQHPKPVWYWQIEYLGTAPDKPSSFNPPLNPMSDGDPLL